MRGMRGLAAVALATAILGAARSGAADDKKQATHPGTSSEPTGCNCETTTRATRDEGPGPHKAARPAVEEVNRRAESLADRVNRAMVGDKVQNENNWAAAHPREAERRESAIEDRFNVQPEGRANMQAEGRRKVQPEGRTSMQPGEPAPPNEAGGLQGMVRDTTHSVDHPGTYDPLSIEINPLGLFVGGRLSFNAQWAPVVHHALIVSPHFVHTTSNIATSGSTMESQAFTGIGGEVGYRYYTGHRGMNGVFVGPSLIAGVYNAGLPSSNQPFTNIGVAADVGVQDIIGNHLVLGGGVGIEYLSVSHDFGDLPAGPSTIASSGFKPRLLLSAGYGF